MPTYQHASRAGLEILYLLELLILQEYPLENFRRIYLEYNNLQKRAYEKSKLE